MQWGRPRLPGKGQIGVFLFCRLKKQLAHSGGWGGRLGGTVVLDCIPTSGARGQLGPREGLGVQHRGCAESDDGGTPQGNLESRNGVASPPSFSRVALSGLGLVLWLEGRSVPGLSIGIG